MPENEETHEQETGSGLRKQLEEALAELKKYRTQEKLQTVERTLAERGFDPEASAFVASQVEKPEDVESWLETNGRFLAKKQEEQPPNEEVGEEEKSEAKEELKQFFSKDDGSSRQEAQSDFAKQLEAVTTQAELHALMNKYGYNKPYG